MAGKVKTWVWVLVGIAVVCVLGVIALAAAGFYLVSRHVETQAMTPAGAAAEFEAARSRFEGQTPLVELDEAGRFVRAHTERPVPVEAQPAAYLHLLAFDPSDERMVRFRVPFWVLKMQGNVRVELNGRQLRLDDLKLTAADLERYGPALVVDHTAPSGERVLVWSE